MAGAGAGAVNNPFMGASPDALTKLALPNVIVNPATGLLMGAFGIIRMTSTVHALTMLIASLKPSFDKKTKIMHYTLPLTTATVLQ